MPDHSDLTMPLRVLQTPPRPPRSTTSLTMRAVLTGLLVALVSVLVTALVAVPLAAKFNEKTAREALAGETTAVAAALKPRIRTANVIDEQKLITQLRKQDIDAYLIRDGVATPAGLPERIVREIANGNAVSERALVQGQVSMIEGRSLDDRDGVVLVRPLTTGLARQVMQYLWLPLLAGLAAGALAGVVLGRRLARPIRNAAIAAARLSSGDRAVRLAAEPPQEVERLAVAINELAEALTASEGRQREFLMSISHELRTPLTTIRGYAEALSDGVVTEESAVSVGRTVQAEAERLDRLVADLLSLARLEAADFTIEPTRVDLGELIRSAEQAFGPRCAQHGIRLRSQTPVEPVVVATDPVRLRQIVDGLMENALRVVPPGSPIILSVAAGPTAAVVEVRDGGPGLTDEDLAVAFDKGVLNQRYQGVRKVGSGLGLALVAGLSRRLGGRIEAGHAPEGGARFTLYLPRTSA